MTDSLVLRPGAERALPDPLFGFNSSVIYDFPIERPDVVSLVSDLCPRILRYPGGTESNFFDWRTGQMHLTARDDSSGYRRWMAEVAPWTHQLHPDGVPVERMATFCESVGAEYLIVPNLETSTPSEQAEWFARLHARGLVPRRVELGNEFWIATLSDPESLARFPDCETTMRIMRECTEALRPSLPEDALVAVQAAGVLQSVSADPGPAAALVHREWAWDAALRPEDWFQAVTVHFYPEVVHVASRDASADEALPYLLARCDEGVDRTVRGVADALPGIEIWVTEWGIGEIDAFLAGRRPKCTGLWINVLARGMLSFLRHPEVTILQYHGLMFDGGVWGVFRRDRDTGEHHPIGPVPLLRWFHEAAIGASYAPVDIEGVARHTVETRYVGTESYDEIAAGMFRRGGTTTLIVHSAASSPRTIDLSQIAGGRTASRAETIATPDLDAPYHREPPAVSPLAVDGSLVSVPGRSTTRIAWT